MKNKIFIGLLIIFLAQLLFRIYSYRSDYFSRYDAKYWKQRYLKSQWVVPNSKQPIGDDGLYAYSGWEYVNGRDPTTLNAEVPPLGKYLIGLSIIAFHNQNIFALLSGFLVLAAFYFLNTAVFEDRLVAFLPVALFSFEPLFYTQLRAPFLDLLYLGFFLLSVNFFLRKGYFVSSLFLGLMAATKNSLSAFILVIAAMLICLLLRRQFAEIKKYLFSLPVALVVLLLSYAQFFLLGHNLRNFLSVQKYAIHFYAIGAKGSFFAVWQMLLTGQWQTWFNGVQKVAEWTILWPAILVLTIYYIVTQIFKWCSSEFRNFAPSPNLSLRGRGNLPSPHVLTHRKKFPLLGGEGQGEGQNNINFFTLWLIIYLLFLSFIPVFPRYLLLALPFLYNVSIWALTERTSWFSRH